MSFDEYFSLKLTVSVCFSLESPSGKSRDLKKKKNDFLEEKKKRLALYVGVHEEVGSIQFFEKATSKDQLEER